MSNPARYPDLEGQTVVITGGASGIGSSIVAHFAAQGAKLAALDIDRSALDDLALAIKNDCGADIETAEIDLRDITKLNLVLSDLIRGLPPEK
jgi:D-xylose 1-dehydrogenase